MTAAQGQDLGLDPHRDPGPRLVTKMAVVTDTAHQAPMTAPMSTNGDANENNDPVERISTMSSH